MYRKNVFSCVGQVLTSTLRKATNPGVNSCSLLTDKTDEDVTALRQCSLTQINNPQDRVCTEEQNCYNIG